jgi:hypothetical protein
MNAPLETYPAGLIKRGRRTKGQVEQLERQILEVLCEDHPQSVRHVFYRMTNPRLPEPVAKTDQGYDQVQSRITLMRREGKLPYGWVSDTSRRGYFTATYHSGVEFLRRHISAYRADLWGDAGVYCEVWTESRSLAGVIVNLCEQLAVSLYPAGGFSSISFAHDAALSIQEEVADGRPAHIFYIGDYDPAGVLIDHSLETELRQHLPADIDMRFSRLAITEDQIAAYDLPTKPRKESERRAPHLKETVEAEAMPAGVMRALLRHEIEALLPENALLVAKVAEESEREQLALWAGIMELEA